MAIEYAALAKAGAPLAGKLAKAGWQRTTLSWLVALRVRMETKKHFLPVPPYMAFRRYLRDGEPFTTFTSGDPEQFKSLARDIKSLPFGTDWMLDDVQARQFIEVLLSAYTHHLPPNAAVEAQSKTAVAELTRQIDEVKAMQASPAAAFDAELRCLAPLRAEHARELASIWPAIHRFVRELGVSTNRRNALRDWCLSRPAWFDEMNAAALLWLAELAADYELKTESIALIGEALTQGGTPADYWQIRRFLLEAGEDGAAQQEQLRQYAGQHPVADALMAAWDGSTAEALAILRAWDPHDESAAAFRTVIHCQLLAANGDLDHAIQVGRDALQSQRISGPAQLAAAYLLERGSFRESALHHADLEASLKLALEVRNAIRLWQGPSHRAAVIAIRAAQLLGDNIQAWLLSQPAPVGEATVGETTNVEVRKLAVVIAAESRPMGDAQRLVDGIDDSLARREAQALLAERQGDVDSARELWARAGALAQTPQEQLRVGFPIAMHGLEPEHVEALVAHHATRVDELKLIASVFAGTPGQLEVLRTQARQSRPLTFALITYLNRDFHHAQAAKIAADGGARWSDGELWHTAAREYLKASDFGAAADAARSVLRVAESGNSNQKKIYATLIEALSSNGRWREAAEAAEKLMSRDRGNASAVWAVVTCHVQLGQLEKAWTAYSQFGGCPPPRTEDEAVIRIELWRQFQDAPDSLDELFEVLDAWSGSKRVRVAVTHVLLSFNEEVSESAAERISSRLTELLASLEDVFGPQRISLDDPRATLDALVAQIPDTSDLDRQIEEGVLPFGIAASVYHRSYVELLSCRTGVVFAGDTNAFDAEVAAARAARAKDAVIDVTALLTMSFVDHNLGDRMLGYIGSAIATLAQRLDAVHATEQLSRRSTMTMSRSVDGSAQVHEIPEDEADKRFQRATRVLQRFEVVKCVERSALSNLSKIQDARGGAIWLTALDLALDEAATPFWCDDSKIRQLATSMGASSFGTSALIEAMRIDGLLDEDLATTLQAILITHHYVGLDFRRDWLETAATLENWRPQGAASFIMWGPSTAHPEDRLRFVFDALERTAHNPDSIRGWVEAASRWLIKVGGGGAQSNLVWLLQMLFRQAWLTADQLPFVLSGIRNAAATVDLTDPFEEAVLDYYQFLVRQIGSTHASTYIRSVVRLTGEQDRLTTARMVLTDGLNG